jgi:hypothetical protein
MAAIDRSIYESLILEQRGGGNTIDVRLGTISVDYYEDIFSPTVTATVVILDNGVISGFDVNCMTPDGERKSVYQGLPLRGGERVLFKVAGNSESNPGIDYATGDTLYVSNIANVVSETQREMLVLNLTSREAIINETQSVTKKYPTSSPISVSAENIIKEFLKPTRKIEVDKTINTYGFLGNSRKPFSLLVSLASKAVPERSEKDETAGYVFFQTVDGLFFKSIDELINKGPKATYTYTDVNRSRVARNNDYNILSYSTNKNEKLIENLRLGAYASKRVVFDPYTFKVNFVNYDKEKYTKDLKSFPPAIVAGTAYIPPVSSYTPLPAPQPQDVPYIISSGSLIDLGKSPSRTVASILDRGVYDEDVSTEKNAEALKYQSQSLTRYNSIFVQMLTMTVPSNTNLRAGDMIKCQFPSTSTSKKKGFDQAQSGLYMIKALCHHFDSNGSYTSMKLVRDTFEK